MKFAEIPIDICCFVTTYLHYLDVANLLFSGDRALNTRLLNGGVTEMRIYIGPFGGRWSLPAFCHTLRLNRISLQQLDTRYNSFGINALQMSNVLKTIKSLTISLEGAFPALQERLKKRHDLFPLLEDLEIRIHEHEVPNRDVAIRWPRNLRSLVLIQFASRNFALDPAELPVGLTKLSGVFSQVINPKNVNLPETLTWLNLRMSHMQCDPVPLLPAGLKKLTLSFAYDHDSDLPPMTFEVTKWAYQSIKLLPRGLTYLDLPIFEYIREDLEQLPPTILRLFGGSIAPNNFDALPRSLLLTPTCSRSIALEKDCISRLPRSLEAVCVTPTALPHLNPNNDVALQVIVQGYNTGLLEELEALQMKQLSPYIVDLEIASAERWAWKATPPNLTRFSIEYGTVTSADLSILPATITDLRINKGKVVGSDTWKCLPPKLKHLTINEAPACFDANAAAALPRTLTWLKLHLCEVPPTLRWFEALPPMLRTIDVPLNPKTTASSWRLHLPSTLASFSLSIEFPTIPQAAAEVFTNILASLPPHLESLRITSSPKVYPGKDIPYTLEILRKLLPRRLTKLYLPKSEFVDVVTLCSTFHSLEFADMV